MNSKVNLLKPQIIANSTASVLFTVQSVAVADDREQTANFVLWLYDLPQWVPSAFLAILFTALFLIALTVYRRWSAAPWPGVYRKRTTYFAAATGALAGIVLAVLLSETWETYLFKIITGMPPTAVGPPPSVNLEEKRKQAERLTMQLHSLIASYRGASAMEKPGLEGQLSELAQQRRQLLLELASSAPAEVLRVALPDAMQHQLPAKVTALLEKHTEIEGVLDVLHVDYDEPEKSHFQYFLNTEFGERFSLHFALDGAEHKTGSHIRANGLLIPASAEEEDKTDGALTIESGDTDITVLALGGSITASVPVSGLSNTFGEQPIAVLLVNFQDNPSNQPWTVATISSIVNGTSSNFFKENSYQQTWLKADVYGWYTMALDSTACVLNDIETAAKNKATENGVDLSPYSRYIFVFPYNSTCGFTGAGTVGGNPSRAWINGNQAWTSFTHELGHNLGLAHSHSLDCGANSIGGTCTVSEYGDKTDIMGSPTSGHFNAFQKERLGWLGYASSPPLLTVEAGGMYTLDGYATAGTNPKALKILQSTDATTGKNTWYYIEYRQAFGFDNNLVVTADSNVLHGILVRKGSETSGNSGYLLDMTPETASWYDPALIAGDNFTDSNAGISVTTLWENGTQAAINVNVSNTACLPANPQIAISPAQSQWVAAGTAQNFTVTVTNKDGASCAGAAFILTSGVPDNWNGVYDNASLTLAPGASGSRTLSVTSQQAAADGFYNVMAVAAHGSYTASASATYVVSSAAANQPPVANNDSAAVNAGAAVQIAVLNNDSDPDGDTLSVASIAQGGGGTVTLNTGNSLIYTANTGFSGTDSFTYAISDGQGGSDTAIVTVTVSVANQAPVAANDSAKTKAGTPVTIAVLNNDSDANNDPLSVVSATQGSKGSVKINPDKTVTYTPGNKFTSSDTFSYTISDGKATASAQVTVTKIK